LDESKEHGGSAEVGQFWTPFIPLSGSLLHADSHVVGISLAAHADVKTIKLKLFDIIG